MVFYVSTICVWLCVWVMMYSGYDVARSGHADHILLSMLADRAIAYQFIEYEAEGHVFATDFDKRLQDAIAFLFQK